MRRSRTVTEIQRSIEIEAPPEAVFRELVDLHRLSRWSTITESHTGPDVLELGQAFEQTIRVGGVKLATEWRCVELEAPRLVAYEATGPGGARLRMRQTVTPSSEGSRVELTVEYDLPGGVIGEVVDRLHVERRNEREAEHSLQNLKDLVEGQL